LFAWFAYFAVQNPGPYFGISASWFFRISGFSSIPNILSVFSMPAVHILLCLVRVIRAIRGRNSPSCSPFSVSVFQHFRICLCHFCFLLLSAVAFAKEDSKFLLSPEKFPRQPVQAEYRPQQVAALGKATTDLSILRGGSEVETKGNNFAKISGCH